MIWRDSLKNLVYYQREVVQIIKCRGDDNCGKHGFVKKYFNEGLNFLRINLLQLEIGFVSLFQCEIKLTKQFFFFLIFSRGGNNSGGRCKYYGLYSGSLSLY